MNNDIKHLPNGDFEVVHVSEVIELPTGQYDAVRTLRHLLQQAEKGEVKNVVVIVFEDDDLDNDSQTLSACWSDMTRMDILWAARWFNSWLNNRYFAKFHREPEDEI